MPGGREWKHGRAPLQPQASDDLELLRRARRGDGTAFHALVDRYARLMYGLAYSMLNDSADAEDVVQETFAGAFRALSKFEERSSVKTWLSRILMNQVAMHRRDRRGNDDRATSGQSLDEIEAAGAGVDARLDLQSMLQTLSDEHRQVLVLRELQQMSYDEIAGVLSVPRGTVESRLFRARAELRKKLGDYLS
jgi:RNA polymerase sigma-70 factor (ECF subfamily)